MDPNEGTAEITQLLERINNGDRASEAQLLQLVHAELRQLAAKCMRRERRDHTLQPSALVNEAYLKMLGPGHHNWVNRGHFYSAASRTMRTILIDYARTHGAEKRGGVRRKVELNEGMAYVEAEAETFLALDQALSRLAEIDPRQAQIVELRFFGGLSVTETAASLDVSEKTVKRDWAVARAWLEAELRGEAA